MGRNELVSRLIQSLKASGQNPGHIGGSIVNSMGCNIQKIESEEHEHFIQNTRVTDDDREFRLSECLEISLKEKHRAPTPKREYPPSSIPNKPGTSSPLNLRKRWGQRGESVSVSHGVKYSERDKMQKYSDGFRHILLSKDKTGGAVYLEVSKSRTERKGRDNVVNKINKSLNLSVEFAPSEPEIKVVTSTKNSRQVIGGLGRGNYGNVIVTPFHGSQTKQPLINSNKQGIGVGNSKPNIHPKSKSPARERSLILDNPIQSSQGKSIPESPRSQRSNFCKLPVEYRKIREDEDILSSKFNSDSNIGKRDRGTTPGSNHNNSGKLEGLRWSIGGPLGNNINTPVNNNNNNNNISGNHRKYTPFAVAMRDIYKKRAHSIGYQGYQGYQGGYQGYQGGYQGHQGHQGYPRTAIVSPTNKEEIQIQIPARSSPRRTENKFTLTELMLYPNKSPQSPTSTKGNWTLTLKQHTPPNFGHLTSHTVTLPPQINPTLTTISPTTRKIFHDGGNHRGKLDLKKWKINRPLTSNRLISKY